jgi:hypothetical protein
VQVGHERQRPPALVRPGVEHDRAGLGDGHGARGDDPHHRVELVVVVPPSSAQDVRGAGPLDRQGRRDDEAPPVRGARQHPATLPEDPRQCTW